MTRKKKPKSQLARRPIGRPSLLVDGVTDVFVEHLADPNAFIIGACTKVGISRRCFRGWMERGEASEEEPYRTFYLRVSEARLKQAQALLRQGDEHAAEGNRSGTSWSEFKLKKLHPKLFSDKQALEISGPDGGPIEHAEVTPEDRRQAIEVMVALEEGAKDVDD